MSNLDTLRPLLKVLDRQTAVLSPGPSVREEIEHAKSADTETRTGKRAPTATDRSTGSRIRALRRAAGMTLSDLGRAAGVSLVQIQRYETGASRVTVDRLIAISDALGVRFSALTGEPLVATVAEVVLLLYRNEIEKPAGVLEATTDPARSPASVAPGHGIAVRHAQSGAISEAAIPNQDGNSDDARPGWPKIDDGHDRPAGGDPHFAVELVKVLPSLRRQAMALTRNRADAEDLLQTAMTNALGAQGSFRVGTNIRAWMSCILRNQFFSEFRRRRVFVELDDAPPSLTGCSGAQEECVLLRETRRFIAGLPAAQQVALSMVAIEGLSYEEVAGQLGIPVGTVKARVFRARESLQHWMRGRAGGTCIDRSAGSRAAVR